MASTATTTPPSSDETDAAATRTRDRYLTLLRDALCDCVYTSKYDESLRMMVAPADVVGGSVFPVHGVTMVGWHRLHNLRAALEDVVRRGVPGDFMETGVWRGGACIYAKAVLDTLPGAGARRVIVADSFQGLPVADPVTYPREGNDGVDWSSMTFLAVSETQVRANFQRFDLLDDGVVFHAGFFADSFVPGKPLPFKQLAVLRLDGDMYGSTIAVLNAAYDAVPSGGYVIVDDYSVVNGARAAVDDFRREHDITSTLVPIDWTGVYWIKA